jgi:hypothetical protein
MMTRKIALCLGWGLAGAFTGVVFHYFLYRISLPMTPFVYQSF